MVHTKIYMFTNTRALLPSHKNYLTLPKTIFANTLNNAQTINANTVHTL